MSNVQNPADVWLTIVEGVVSAGLNSAHAMVNSAHEWISDVTHDTAAENSIGNADGQPESTWSHEFLEARRSSQVLLRFPSDEEINADLIFWDQKEQTILDALRKEFQKQNIQLSDKAVLLVKEDQFWWEIQDLADTYTILKDWEYNLNVYKHPLAFDPLGDATVLKFLNETTLYGLPEDSEARKALDPNADDAMAHRRMRYLGEALAYLKGDRVSIDPVEINQVVLRDYFEQKSALPEWADTDLIEKAQAVFDLYRIPYMIALLYKSLPETYACWRGAQVLSKTGRLVLGDKQGADADLDVPILARRVVVTGRFVVNVLSEGGLAPGGKGVQTIQVLRLLHSGIRVIFQNGLPVKRWGTPINQEDMAMTLMAFSIEVMEGMKKLGIFLSSDEEDALLHTWKVVGYLLGIQEDLMPDNVADGKALWTAICARQQKMDPEIPDAEERAAGKELTDALIQYAQKLTPVNLPQEIPAYMIRHMIGNDLADALGVVRGSMLEPQMLAGLGYANGRVAQMLADHSLVFKELLRYVNMSVFETFLEDWVDDRPVVFFERSDDSSTSSETPA